MRFTALSALLGLLAVQQAAAVSFLFPPFLKEVASKLIDDRVEVTHQIGNALRVSPFAQNPPTSAAIRKRLALVAPKIRSQQVALVQTYRAWVLRTQITAP